MSVCGHKKRPVSLPKKLSKKRSDSRKKQSWPPKRQSKIVSAKKKRLV